MEKLGIIIVRMRSGEDVVSTVSQYPADHATTPNGFLLKKPAMLVPAGKGQLALMPWLMYADTRNGVTVPKEATFFTVKPQQQLESEYTNFVSDLVVPEKTITQPNLRLITE